MRCARGERVGERACGRGLDVSAGPGVSGTVATVTEAFRRQITVANVSTFT
jgi:hypothetical protein